MNVLQMMLQRLAPGHREALSWFRAHAGEHVGWPEPLPSGVLLATKAKGIYKPKGMEYALSVRQTLDGPYADHDPVTRSDGTWTYFYYQEGQGLAARDALFTNRGLLACMRDEVPIGVLQQVSGASPVTYKVLGLALVAGWENGYFHLEGFSPTGLSYGAALPGSSSSLLADAIRAAEAQPFQPDNLQDARKRTMAAIVQRQGQATFRAELIRAYGGRCAISGCDAPQALEASHIIPYLGEQTNHLSNGLLLRADIHTLFDLGLVAVETSTMTVVLAPALAYSSYGDLQGRRLHLPSTPGTRPSLQALDQHRALARQAW